MSHNRHAKQTDENQEEIVRGLRAVPGCTVAITARPVDLCVGYNGINYLMEIKRPLGPRGGDPSRRTDDQKKFFREWRGTVHEVRSLAHALQIIGVSS